MFQFRTLLILFVISFAFISNAYAEAEEDEFAMKSRRARSGRSSGSDSGRHPRAVNPIPVQISNRQRRAVYLGYAYGSRLFARHNVAVAAVAASGIHNMGYFAYGKGFPYAYGGTVHYAYPYYAHAVY